MHRGDDLPVKKDWVIAGLGKEEYKLPDYLVKGDDMAIPLDYAIFDYSDLVALGDQAQAQIQQIMIMEDNVSQSSELVYDKGNIRVYKFD